MNTTYTTTRSAWDRYYTRQAAKRDAFTPSINYGAVIAAAEDYLSAMAGMYEQRVKNGYRAGEECWLNSKRNANILHAWDIMDDDRNTLYGICNVVGISSDAAIRAARAMLKWYGRTEQRHYPDAEKLLRVMA